MAKEIEEDIPTKFWNKWLRLDGEKRIKHIQTLMVVRELTRLMENNLKGAKIPREHIVEMVAREVNDLFCDLENTILSKK